MALKKTRRSFSKETVKAAVLSIVHGTKTPEQIERELKMRSRWGRYQVEKWVLKYQKQYPELLDQEEKPAKDFKELLRLQAKIGELMMENERLRNVLDGLRKGRTKSSNLFT